MDDYSNSPDVSSGKEDMRLRNAQNLVVKLEILGPWENELIEENTEGTLVWG